MEIDPAYFAQAARRVEELEDAALRFERPVAVARGIAGRERLAAAQLAAYLLLGLVGPRLYGRRSYGLEHERVRRRLGGRAPL